MRKSAKKLFELHRQHGEHPKYIKRLLPAVRAEVNAKQYRDFLGYFQEELGRLSQYPESYAINSAEQLLDVVAEFRTMPDLSRDQAIAIVSSVAGATCSRGSSCHPRHILLLSRVGNEDLGQLTCSNPAAVSNAHLSADRHSLARQYQLSEPR